jgi:hypothetical protein
MGVAREREPQISQIRTVLAQEKPLRKPGIQERKRELDDALTVDKDSRR